MNKQESFINGSLFELIPAKITRENIAEEVYRQCKGIQRASTIQKICLGIISQEIEKDKQRQAVRVSIEIAHFIIENKGDLK